MSNLYKKLVFVAALVAGSLFMVIENVQLAEASTFSVVQGIPYTVSKTILPADTTITLSSFNSPGGLAFTMSNFGSLGYATLDPNNLSRLETVTFTGITNNGTSVSLTGVTRGIDFVSPYTASTTLQRIHLVGSSLILSNPGAFYGQQFALLNAASSIGAIWTFGSTTMPMYDSEPSASMWSGANGTALVDLNKLNATTIAGAANASESQNGISQLATGAQAASSTSLGSTGARLVIPASLATSSDDVAGLHSVMTQNSGKINWNQIDLGTAFTVTGALTVTASSTYSGGFASTGTTTIAASSLTTNPLVLNALPYKLSPSRAASSTVLEENGSGSLSFEPVYQQVLSTTTFQTMGSATISSFGNYNDLRLMIGISTSSAADVQMNLQFNGDTGTNYGYSSFQDYVVSTKVATDTSIVSASGVATTSSMYFVFDILNNATLKKMVNWTGSLSASGALMPLTEQGSAVWNNETAQITSIKIQFRGGSANVPGGTVIRLYGD